jgi:hypothetical protein
MDISRNTREASLRDLNTRLAATGSTVVMGPHKILRECDESNMRVETQDVEVWTPGAGKLVARFTTYRCRATGKPVIANVDVVEED